MLAVLFLAVANTCDTNSGNGIIGSDSLPKTCADSNTLQTLLTIGFGVIGAIALLMIVVAGLRYITAQGDPTKTATARNQLLYALIGLVIAGLAEAIVNYVLNFQ